LSAYSMDHCRIEAPSYGAPIRLLIREITSRSRLSDAYTPRLWSTTPTMSTNLPRFNADKDSVCRQSLAGIRAIARILIDDSICPAGRLSSSVKVRPSSRCAHGFEVAGITRADRPLNLLASTVRLPSPREFVLNPPVSGNGFEAVTLWTPGMRAGALQLGGVSDGAFFRPSVTFDRLDLKVVAVGMNPDRMRGNSESCGP